MGQRIHAIFMYLNSLTFERSIVIGGKHDGLIPMGTRVTPKPLASVGKVVGFNFLTIICGYNDYRYFWHSKYIDLRLLVIDGQLMAVECTFSLWFKNWVKVKTHNKVHIFMTLP